MPEDDIVRIRINNNLIGIVGLTQVMEEMAKPYSHRPDDETGMEMIRRLEVNNYIPRGARPVYAKSLVREFRRYLGQPVEEEPGDGLCILVLGPGCARCTQMEIDVREVLAEMNLPGELQHVTDIREIGRYGVLGLPALVINDRVLSVGTIPHRNKIKEWLCEAINNKRKE